MFIVSVTFAKIFIKPQQLQPPALLQELTHYLFLQLQYVIILDFVVLDVLVLFLVIVMEFLVGLKVMIQAQVVNLSSPDFRQLTVTTVKKTYEHKSQNQPWTDLSKVSFVILSMIIFVNLILGLPLQSGDYAAAQPSHSP